ncbi:hypothetical protein M3B37_25035, partial [Klebsiella quasipneumoniae]|nr:hypothetical protein [Klebsiella quasipneumoniae]
QRRRAVNSRAGACLRAGWRLTPYPAYSPTGDRRTRRPGKRSAAGRPTAERVLVFMPDGG